MDVVLLGTGTLRPQAETASAGMLFVEDENVLPADLGRNVLSRMIECGVDPLVLPEFLVTHLHPDHTCEIVSLLFALKYGRRGADPVRLTGPHGLRRLVDGLTAVWPWLEAEYPLAVREIDGGVLGVKGFEVEAIRLEHGNTTNLGYRVRSERSGALAAFTGDTGPCEALVDLARGVDLLVAECATTDAGATAFHMAPTALGRAAAEAGVGHLVITHLYPETPAEEVLAGVRAVFDGRVTIGQDRMRVAVGNRLRRA